ncbi:hypothetical protein GCM10023093_18600 [Nemorincola caseinilytica]|uniref:Gliding motility-associated C-terminal domain-containing protein n=1 Tax=Nemorincola caseinilytica TaxID=2054315 RepID=A0ABP8NE20_9BACT
MKRHLFALLLILGVYGAFAQATAPKPRFPDNTSLDQWWPFCSATDLLDRTFTGFDLIGSSVTPTSDRFLVPNRAYEFNGFNSELHYTTTLIIPMFGIADFTYSCHIFPTAAQHAIIMYNGDPSNDGLGLIMTNAAGTGAGTQIGILFGGLTTYVPAGSTVTLGQWHHLVLKRNGNSYMLYIDGTFVGPAYIPAGFPASGYNTPTTVFQLGLDLTAGDKAFSGKIDDVATYSRQLSNLEIMALYNFDPNIVFTLGPDTAICPNAILIGGARDTTRLDTVQYPNYEVNSTYGFDYTWSNGDTVSTRQNITFPTTPVPPTIRTLTLSRRYSCPASSTIRITHIIPTVYIGPDTSMCDGESFLLNPTPGTGLMRYLWNTGATVPSIIADTTASYWLRVDSLVPFVNPITNLNDTTHCIGTDTAHVTVTPEIFVHVAEFDTSCDGTPIILYSYDDTAYTAPTYSWDDGINPPVLTPSLTVTTSGVYTLTVTDGACIRSDVSTITIVNVATTVLSNDTAICKGASVLANATGTPGVQYQWTPSAGIAVSNIPTPTIIPDTSAWYVVTATILDPVSGGLLNCASRDSFFIDVQPNPTVKMGGNRMVCQYDSIRISPIVTPYWYTNYIYDWTPGRYLDDSTTSTVIFTAGDTTKLILVVSTPAGCKSSDSAIIYTFNGDFMTMASDTALCPGDSVLIGAISSEPGVTSYSWQPPTYVNYPEATTPITIKPINSINYKLIGTSMYGCRDTLTYSIKVFPAAVVTLEDSVSINPGASYNIEPITNCTYFSWFPPTGLDDTTASTPVATPPVSTRYVLTARTQDNCITKDSISIRLNDNAIIGVPNAFTPGGDKYNVLNVALKGVARLRYFRIYDRWGKVVYESRDINAGWDGTIGGTPQPMGVYVYEVEAITDRGKILHKQGNVTLLR